MQIKHWQLIASNLLPSDAAGPIFFEAHEISSDLEQVNLVTGEPGRNYQSFFFLDGWQGQPEGGSSALRLGRGKKSGFQNAARGDARFFHGCQSGSLWRECRGDINEKITLWVSDPITKLSVSSTLGAKSTLKDRK